MDAMKRRPEQPTTWLGLLGLLITGATNNGMTGASTASVLVNAIEQVTVDV